MKKGESLYYRDWFRIGDKELRRAENLLDHDDLEGAGFNIQQAIEKYFKGYLLSRGWKLRRIHNLETLLNDVIVYDSSFEKFRSDCLRITYYYIEDRYPLSVTSEFREEEMRDSLQVAKDIIDKIKIATD